MLKYNFEQKFVVCSGYKLFQKVCIYELRTQSFLSLFKEFQPTRKHLPPQNDGQVAKLRLSHRIKIK